VFSVSMSGCPTGVRQFNAHSKFAPWELGLCLSSGTLPLPLGLGIAENVEDWTMTNTAKHLSLVVAVMCAVTAPALGLGRVKTFQRRVRLR
jgi:hypothetical protein